MKRTLVMAGLVAVGALALGGRASAQMYTPPPSGVDTGGGMGMEVLSPTGYNPQTGFGVGLMAGGGGGNYVDDLVRADTGAFGAWNIRAILGTRTFVGFEGAYVGAAGSISGFGLNGSDTLIRNGAEGLFRVQVPVAVRASIVEPYVFGGLGWDHYSFTTTPTATASLTAHDDTLTTPFGAGIGGSYMGILADVRFTYRPTFDENLFGATDTGLTNWNVGGSLGYEF